jgi:TIR domain
MGKPIIFVSHFTEEASVARELASSLGSLCNNEFDFFVASPQASLRGGEEWERTIVEKIKSCEAMLLLMSQASMLRPWVNFESGIARGMEKMIIPCCILGLRREHLARPYSSFQSLQLDSFADFMTLAEQMGHLKGHLAPISEPDCRELHERFMTTLNDPVLISRSRAFTLPQGAIYCHGTKYTVPNSGIFWNNLLTSAKERFILIGGSNKSWLAKSKSQSQILADGVQRILGSGGTVNLVIDSEPTSSEMLATFCLSHLQHPVVKSAENRFKCCISDEPNYSAVVSDQRLLIIPLMNSEQFRAESMVVEIVRDTNPSIFDNYVADIERTIDSSGEFDPWPK